ncbi:MAG: YgjV family protein [Ruminococcaceae bacterium]|nr:YgjV family protein [Oscillospiraceae bacterium]
MILAGQIIGWIAALLTFLSYQCKDHKKLIVVQTLSTLSICISYLFLNAWSGMLLNVVCIVRNFIIYRKDLRIFSYSFWPYVLSGVMAVMGIVSWQGPMSLLIVVALAVNTLFLYFPNMQNLRRSILLTSTMILIYNVYYAVWGGVANELIAISSAIIGLYRYRKPNHQ